VVLLGQPALDFDSILAQAQTVSEATSDTQAQDAGKVKTVDPLTALGRVDQIDNASLLKFIGSNQA
jgi:hypothetical protein